MALHHDAPSAGSREVNGMAKARVMQCVRRFKLERLHFAGDPPGTENRHCRGCSWNQQPEWRLTEGKAHAHRVRVQWLNKVLIDASTCNSIPQLPSQNDLECHHEFARTPEADDMDIEACIHLKSGMIPHYQEELYTIVYQDCSNFCSEIKKLCVHNIVSLYGLEPPSKGKEQNFTDKALYTISTAAYYGTSQKLLGQTLEFKEYLPEAAVVLVTAGIKSILCSLEQHGKIHDLRTQVEPINQKVVNHQVSGPHLQQQLERWVKCASQGISKTGIGLVAGDEDEYALAPMDYYYLNFVMCLH
ncbi:hypothetical protein EDD15DRAFT_2449366 [Pisolithus albus]|nr:hypothetical protein EDD15DRAFT_2449366 [Pisolithus albus]